MLGRQPLSMTRPGRSSLSGRAFPSVSPARWETTTACAAMRTISPLAQERIPFGEAGRSDAVCCSAICPKLTFQWPIFRVPARRFLESLNFRNPDDPKTAKIDLDARPGHRLQPGLSERKCRRHPARLAAHPAAGDRKALEASAALGEQIAALLDTETDVPGVTCGKIRSRAEDHRHDNQGRRWRTRPDGRRSGGNGRLGAFWQGRRGHAGQGQTGRTRNTIEDEAKAIDAEAAARGMSAAEVRRLLGETTCDVYPERRGLLAQHPAERVGVLPSAAIRSSRSG